MTDDRSDFRERHLRRGDFLGAFGVVRREGRILMVQNERVVHGSRVETWDLPGGQVEPGELLDEALRRELHEETGIRVVGSAPFLFYQEGEKVDGGTRRYAWRSFFFEVRGFEGEPEPCGEIRRLRWFVPDELDDVLHAPYHDSFRTWIAEGGTAFRSVWSE